MVSGSNSNSEVEVQSQRFVHLLSTSVFLPFQVTGAFYEHVGGVLKQTGCNPKSTGVSLSGVQHIVPETAVS